MTVAVLVPRRSDGGHRDRLWAFAKALWLTQAMKDSLAPYTAPVGTAQVS